EGLEFFSRAHEVDPARRLPLLAAFCLNRLIGDELATEASFLELIRPTKLASGYNFNTVAPTWN
ncbi:MAG: hypothetical protein GWO24_06755, partial [Akkermansiaceae bacterium]|nr:hypothetical protein [Akkermansiaceae bacterium]